MPVDRRYRLHQNRCDLLFRGLRSGSRVSGGVRLRSSPLTTLPCALLFSWREVAALRVTWTLPHPSSVRNPEILSRSHSGEENATGHRCTNSRSAGQLVEDLQTHCFAHRPSSRFAIALWVNQTRYRCRQRHPRSRQRCPQPTAALSRACRTSSESYPRPPHATRRSLCVPQRSLCVPHRSARRTRL